MERLTQLNEIYETIKQKKENAEREYANTKIPYRVYSNKDYTQGFFKGEINAYNNMIQLLESSGELNFEEESTLIGCEHREFLSVLNKDLEMLEKYRKIEEELGCPLEIVIKALKEDIYVYDVNSNCRKVIKEEPIFILGKDIINEKKGFGFTIIGRYIYLKDYGKTWWLRENEED